MWKKILVVGGVTTAILGAGTAALATTGGGVPTAKPTTGSSTHHRTDPLRTALHATWVTKGATGDVTHDAVRGVITAVSPTSVTVKAADGVSQTYAVTASTVTHTKADGKTKGATGQIGKVEKGDTVGVVGTGTSALTATHVLDRTR